MRIRMVSGSPGPGGGTVYALEIGRRLAARGHRVELWRPAAEGGAPVGASDVELREVPVPSREGTPAQVAAATADALARALAPAAPADVHHAQDTVAALALLALRDEGRIPGVVRTVHHVDVQTDPAMEEAQRHAIQEADALVCVSSYWATRLRAEFGVEPAVVPTGVDAARFERCSLDREAAGRALGWARRRAVLSVGGVARRKGSRVLLEAFARARARLGDDPVLVIAGEPPDHDGEYHAAFLRDADRLGLEVGGPRPASGQAVALLGAVPQDRMPAVYRAADVLACPSTREGFGLAALEAVAAGLPAVVSDLPVFREHLADGRDCLMAPAGDSGGLAGAIVRAVCDETLRARLRAGGRATALRQSWEAAAEAQGRVYAALPVGP